MDEILIPVVFLRPYDRYNVGETAGFSEEKVHQLVTEGFARIKLPPPPERPSVVSTGASPTPLQEEEKKPAPRMVRSRYTDRSLRPEQD